ncbi:MAG: hypothetical protein ACI845_003837 [Gammaproteobacteria bacterium]|jgi:hypothetical protein
MARHYIVPDCFELWEIRLKFNVEAFRAWENKNITLLGMSGVGKSFLSNVLRGDNWFHYSGDYRIGTRYLDEKILDMVKEEAMKLPFLRDMLTRDWIYFRNNIRISDLGPVLSFVGKLGNPELGGVPLDEFIKRQAIYRQAEIDAMYDVPEFFEKSSRIYGYKNFINDVGGSLCDLGEPGVVESLTNCSLILYIQVTNQAHEDILLQRAQSDPKPLYYRPEFLENSLDEYFAETGLQYAAEIDPDSFARWVFPRLYKSRVPRYEAISKPHGYTVTADEVAQVKNERDFLTLIETAIERQT